MTEATNADLIDRLERAKEAAQREKAASSEDKGRVLFGDMALIFGECAAALVNLQEEYEVALHTRDTWRTSCHKAEAENERQGEALEKINDIRNSIIGLQSINWSAHIYPLVAALGDAGIEGEGYDEARKKQVPLAEAFNRNNVLESDNERLRGWVKEVTDDAESGQCEIDVIATGRALLEEPPP